MLKARGKLISLLTACMTLVLTLVMGITALSIQPKVASAAETETRSYTFSSYTAGTQYAKNEEHKLDDVVTVVTNDCHFTSEIRIYSSSTNNGYVVVKSTKSITVLGVNAGNKADKLLVYGSNDEGASWGNAGEISVTSSYTNYTLKLDTSYYWLKLDVSGSNQVRLKSMTLTLVDDDVVENECTHEETTTITTEATCTTTGKSITTCDACGETVSTEAIPATGHNYVEGFCSSCGEEEPNLEEKTLSFADKAQRTSFSTSQQVWEQNGIIFTNNKASSTSNVGDYANPARCYASSEIIIECLNMKTIVFDCNSASYATAVQNSIGTVANTTVTVSSDKVTVDFATTQDSFTIAKMTAQTRLDSITVTVAKEKAPATECTHENTTTTTVEATCTEKGLVTITCDDCGFEVSKEETPANGHDMQPYNVVNEATCVEQGEKYRACANCDLIETVAIPVTGHTNENGVCTVCDEKQPDEATMTFDTKAKRVEYSTEKQVWIEGWVKVTNNKGESTTNVGDYSRPARFYKNSELIVEYGGMIKLVFNCNTAAYATALQNSIGDRDTATVTVEDKVVTVEFNEAVDGFTVILSADQVRMDSINVYKESVEIDSASVTIGADVALNYYVVMNGKVDNVTMNFTMDNEVYDRELTEQTDGRYKVSLELPPQYMANVITVDLLVDGVVVEAMEYSVKMYAQNKLNAADSSTELKQLVTDMLYYGAAAQNYTGHNTESLATKDVENLGTPSTATPEATDLTLVRNDDVTEYSAYFKGAGVRFDAVNSIYVKVVAEDMDNVTLTINGEEVAVAETVYTDGILATEFGKTYTFVLSYNGVVMQTLTYSVNAYAYAKRESATMSELALALYRYGMSAAAYNN